MPERSFSLSEPLGLGQLVERPVDDEHIVFIDPELAVWLTASPDEATILRSIQHAGALGAVLTGPEPVTRSDLASVVARLTHAGFLADRVGFTSTTATRHVQFHLTNRCNLRCTHCYMDSGVKEVPEFDADHWCGLVELLMRRYTRSS
jgi:molybdenum cofactor biosynthesis enzyme MoaA